VSEAGALVGKQADVAESFPVLPVVPVIHFADALPSCFASTQPPLRLSVSHRPMPSATATVTMTLQPTSNKATNGSSNVFTNGVRKFRLDPIPEALAAFQMGEFLVVVDDESRENEGDLIIAASLITTQKMAWFIKHTSCAVVFICAPDF
jgi:hypothetical protein